jgi:uncharacterized phage protein (TIGR02220 family)
LRKLKIPEAFFKSIAEKGGLYSRLWMYWLGKYVDEIFNNGFIAKMEKEFPNYSEINEIYQYGIQTLRQDFEIIEEKPKKTTKEETANAEEIISYLNDKAGSSFTKKGSNIQLIVSRLREGYTIDDFKRVIDTKCKDWCGTDWQKYLRPITLFNKTKFENYLNTTNDKIANDFSKFADSVTKAKQLIAVYRNQ